MSSLLSYLNEIAQEVEKWPEWKLKSVKNAFEIPDIEKKLKNHVKGNMIKCKTLENDIISIKR